MDIGTVRAALKNAINRIDSLEVTDLRDNPNPPCVIVLPDPPFEWDLSFGATPDQHPKFSVLILVPYIDTDDAQAQLDEYLSNESSESVALAIESDDNDTNTLNGAVSSVQVTELKSYGVISMFDGGTRYLSAELTVEVMVA